MINSGQRYVEVLIRERLVKYFGCSKRGCDKVFPDWDSYEYNGKGYCGQHMPRRFKWKTRNM